MLILFYALDVFGKFEINKCFYVMLQVRRNVPIEILYEIVFKLCYQFGSTVRVNKDTFLM